MWLSSTTDLLAMPKLRKRKSEQLPYSGPSVKKSEPDVFRRRSTRGSNKGPDDAVKEKEVFSSIDEPSKLPTKSSNANQKDDSTVPEVTVSATGINALSDEVLIQVFSQLSTKTIVKAVSRTSKRWNALSKDKVLWRFVDVRFACLNPITAKRIFRRYCDPGRLKSLYMRAESPRYGESEIERKQYCQTRCLTPGTMKKLTEVGSQLERFGIEYEQIQWNIDLFSALPSKLTHLSLAHCNLGKDHFNRLFLPGSDSLLKDLLVLDLTGVMVFDLRVLPHLKLPPKLHTLKLRNSELSLYNKGIQQLVLDHHESLVELDLSIMSVCYRFLWDIAEKLKKLEYFNLCGSVIEMDGDDTITHYQGFCIFDDWHEMWGETDGVFESLKTANLRNLTNVAGELMEDPMFMLHPEWPDNLLPTHPDYNKDAYALARYNGA